MLEELKPFIGLLFFIWAAIYFYNSLVYSFGDRKHVNYLVDNLAKKPQKFKDKHYLSMASIGAGGLLILFGLVYPFVRHRRRDKKWTFDAFMWLNWLFSVMSAGIYASGKL